MSKRRSETQMLGTMSARHAACPVCEATAVALGTVAGTFSGREYELYRCDSCKFAFIADPWTEYSQIYTSDYYLGKGADPLVDYSAEITDPKSIRRLEWLGLHKWVSSVAEISQSTKWLDYGCGLAGLVAFLHDRGVTGAVGYEQSESLPEVPGFTPPLLSSKQLEGLEGTFDVITAIEVLEHVPDPVGELRRLRGLLKDGGRLFLTTTNAAPYRNRLLKWRYVIPEIHISFFEPQTMAIALARAGFDPEFTGFTRGWTEIIEFKLLKNLGRNRTSIVDALVPWPLVSRLVDMRFALSGQPVGRARPSTPN